MMDFDDLMNSTKPKQAPNDLAEAFRPMALGVAEYYKGLIASGLEQGVALMLTEKFQEQALRVFGEMWSKQQSKGT